MLVLQASDDLAVATDALQTLSRVTHVDPMADVCRNACALETVSARRLTDRGAVNGACRDLRGWRSTVSVYRDPLSGLYRHARQSAIDCACP